MSAAATEAHRHVGRLSGEVIDRARDLLKKTSGNPDTCPEWERLDDAIRAYDRAADDYIALVGGYGP